MKKDEIINTESCKTYAIYCMRGIVAKNTIYTVKNKCIDLI